MNMKKTFTRLALMALFVVPVSLSYGQIIKQGGNQLAPINKEITGTIFNTSPDLKHHCDGQHCISDALTNQWVEDYGIQEQYKSEWQRGNEMAAQMDGSDRATYTVPIIFHVVHNPNNPAENVSQAAIYALLNAVNADFSASNTDIGNLRTGFGWTGADADIEFCLAQKDPSGQQLAELGIHRVSTTEDFYDPNTEANKMKGDTGGNTGTPGWDRNSYVNVWICDITNGASSGTAGYAYKPTVSSLPPASIDGIVIDYNLGMPPTNRVLTHEIGHYLGLSHTWGNSNQASGCSQDDGLADTPNTAGPSFDYPGSCSGNQTTCSGIQTQYENFMDYANCTIIYTQDQSDLMEAVLNGSRASLLVSTACVPVNPQPPVTNFVADITTVVQNGSINFTDLSTNYPTGWTWTVPVGAGATYLNGTTANSQNPTIQFANTGTYTITLNASNAYGNDDEVKTNYITVVASGGVAIACDTVRNYTPAEGANMAIYTLTGETGYYPSLATIDGGTSMIVRHADSYTASVATNVRRIRFPVLQVDDIGTASNVTFRVWSDVAGLPGAVLGTEIVALSSLNEGFWNVIDFSPQIPVAGNYWVGWELNAASFDTLLMATTNFADRPSGPSSSAMYVNAPFNAWYLTSTIFTSVPDASLILDVLTSNGPAPVALAAWPPNETCSGMDVTMNGYGSSNTASYYWDIFDGTNSYFYDQANLTTPFTAGTWTINLEADGSCLTDIDGPFVLTVNPAMVATFTNQPENCIAQDGQISISITGGDGGPYNYSINNGTTTESSGLYTGLNSGTYNYILTDNNNCELLGTTTVNNANSFAPTISPDQTVPPATATTLTVTGGTSWLWFADDGTGPIEVGSTQSINVAPTVTTSYSCNVTDGSGCEAEMYVTLTITTGIGDNSLENSFDIYPNPTNGEFALIFKLNEPRDMNIKIMNIIGEEVFASAFAQVKNQTVNFDLNSVASGVYFVTIQSGDEMVSKKIVIR